MLADGEAEDAGGGGETEAVDGCVVGCDGLLNYRKLFELRGIELFLRFWGIVLAVVVVGSGSGWG